MRESTTGIPSKPEAPRQRRLARKGNALSKPKNADSKPGSGWLLVNEPELVKVDSFSDFWPKAKEKKETDGYWHIHLGGSDKDRKDKVIEWNDLNKTQYNSCVSNLQSVKNEFDENVRKKKDEFSIYT